MADKKTYFVTEKAGRFVAGIRKPASGKMELTPSQAAHELRLGNLSEVDPAAADTGAQVLVTQDGKATGEKVELSETTAASDAEAVEDVPAAPAPRAGKARR